MRNSSRELLNEYIEKRDTNRVLSSLCSATLKDRRRIFYPFNELSPGINKDGLNKLLIDIVRQAKHTGHWGYQNYVNIGPYTDDSQFNFFIFHEAGHGLIDKTGNKHCFAGDSQKEEDFCHNFSQNACRVLNLPYDQQMEIICRQIGRLDFAPREEQIKFLSSDIFNSPIARVLSLTR